MARTRRGGGWMHDDITGELTKTGTLIIVIGIVIILVSVGLGLYYGMRHGDRPSEAPKSGGGAVAPPYSKRPGRVNIAEVAQAPSAGEAIIYFSQAEEGGVVCDTCTAEFGINITYTGGSPPQEPKYQTVTSPATSGVARFTYGTSAGGFSPLTPGGSNASPPTSMQIDITARSMVPGTGTSGGSTSFSKTLPYVA